MIRNFVGGGFKIQCFYCKTFNITYPQDPDYMHPKLQPCLRQDSALAMFKCIACRQWTKYYWDKRHDLKKANNTAFSRGERLLEAVQKPNDIHLTIVIETSRVS